MKLLPPRQLWLFVILFTNCNTESADWTEFRGPTGQGHANVTDLPVTWSEGENIAWKVALPGHGWSSPVVGDNRIYLTTAVGDDPDQASSRSLRTRLLAAARRVAGASGAGSVKIGGATPSSSASRV